MRWFCTILVLVLPVLLSCGSAHSIPGDGGAADGGDGGAADGGDGGAADGGDGGALDGGDGGALDGGDGGALDGGDGGAADGGDGGALDGGDGGAAEPCPGGPGVLWSWRVGGAGDESVTGLVALDDGGAVVALATESPVLELGSALLEGPGCAPDAGCEDVVLARISSTGDVLWAWRLGGPGSERVHALEKAEDGLLVAGSFTSPTLELGEVAWPNAGARDAFVARVALDGTISWSAAWGGELDDLATVVSARGDGGAFVGGRFRSPLLAVGEELLPCADVDCLLLSCGDLFVAALDGVGTEVWARRFGGPQAEALVALAGDGGGGLWLMGDFGSWQVDFGGPPLALQETICGPMFGCSDLFLAHLDGQGEHLWSVGFGGDLLDHLTAGRVFSQGDVVLVGETSSSSLDFGGELLVNSGDLEGFVARFDSLGNHLSSRRFDARAVALEERPDGLLLAGALEGWQSHYAPCEPTLAGETDLAVAGLGGSLSLDWLHTSGGAGRDGATVLSRPSLTAPVLVGGNFSLAAQLPDGSSVLSAGGTDGLVLALEIP